MTSNKQDETVMKLLHYFITSKKYNVVIIPGIKDEIWLENLKEEHQIVRIITGHIHNEEQFNYNTMVAKQIIKNFRLKTFSWRLNVINVYLDLDEDFNLNNYHEKHMILIHLESINKLNKSFLKEIYPDIIKNTDFKEKGFSLLMKITQDINAENEKEAEIANKVFSFKFPIITYSLIALNIVIFLLLYILGAGSEDTVTLLKFGALFKPLVQNGEYYRIITSAFLHAGLAHLIFNMYALFIIGKELESLLGKTKFSLIYLNSIILGSLASMAINSTTISVGASGALFGILGATFYFGYHYRVYLGNNMNNQLLPVLLLNLLIGFIIPGIDYMAHIGGLIGGTLTIWSLGISNKSSKQEKINGFIMLVIFTLFLLYINFR